MHPKVLFILHHSPPVHGAAKVGDIILNSNLINNQFITRHIKIKSSKKLKEVNKFKPLKIVYFLELFFKTISALIFFRPDTIYFTASPKGFAFYRDFLLVIPIKIYRTYSGCKLFFHYHLKGIEEFTNNSTIKSKLTSFFLNEVHLIFISKIMLSELKEINTFASINFLPNAIEDDTFKITDRDLFKKGNTLNVLYLSAMTKEKGLYRALQLASSLKQLDFIKFNFAGAWFDPKDEIAFYKIVKENQLEDLVSYCGFVSGKKKLDLLLRSNMLLYPSEKDIFPLSILESLSFGIPVLAFNVGAIPEILNDKIGLITDEENLIEDFKNFKETHINRQTFNACRDTYLKHYTIEVFEKRLVSILKLNVIEDNESISL